MEKWRLVADSSCDLNPESLADQTAGFSTVPLKIIVGDAEYVDIPSTDVGEMLNRMKAHKGASSSACPSPDAFVQEFSKAINTIVVTITSGLSGTYNCAMQAREMMLEEHPDRNIHVIDSRSTAGSMVLLLRRIKELISQGTDFPEIVRQAEHYRDQMRILFSLASFDNLVKTGRMSRAAGVLASALNIRAVATNTPEGTIEVLEKPRGEKRAIERMVDIMGDIKDMAGKPVVITHCHNPEGAGAMKKAIEAAYAGVEVVIMETRCLTSFYAGQAGLLLSF